MARLAIGPSHVDGNNPVTRHRHPFQCGTTTQSPNSTTPIWRKLTVVTLLESDQTEGTILRNDRSPIRADRLGYEVEPLSSGTGVHHPRAISDSSFELF